ncbi:MAG: multicopper oxidase domain-containing protein [Thiobacillus sp.]|uniref:multicopper oxidase domain-containing protein n=1 Tax=Thiobacillus sp. 0-1251 TaxID=1895858 RepID=UPI000B0189AD|nr:multicopper oxidase domain-containing protein [Thiobacillus sp. 0-1251]MBN8771133.1 multicopper oxidase domain-containing protein [Thiobacillus sp.]
MGMNGGGGGGGGGMGNACYVYPGAPATPGFVTPDVLFQRGIYMNGSMRFDDGNSVTIWGFTDLAAGGGGGAGGDQMGGGSFPSPAIRVTEGQIVHTALSVNMMWMHTIHHHGIEPSTENDGVGHLSWDVTGGTYTYQWRPLHAGTYFYHCHVNTPLHAEMGMYGALIVDPKPTPGDPAGTKRAFYNGPKYDVEAIWACDEIDPNWHTLPWYAGTCGGDVGLNNLNPRYFIITGVDGASSALTNPAVAVNMTLGQTLLVRYICAGFYPQKISFGGLTASVVASDGRPLPAAWNTGAIEAHSAERYDCIIKPTSRGTWTVTVQFFHWRTGAVLGTAKTRITVA